MKRILTILIVLTLILSGCAKTPSDDKLSIVVGVYVLEEFARRIGGDLVDVVNLVPPGVEAHDFELSAQDRILLDKSDVLLAIGSSFESWLDEVASGLKDTLVVRTGDGLIGDESDPHIWLDPMLAKEIAIKIQNALIEKDLENEATYRANTQTLIKELEELDDLFETSLENRQRDLFIPAHDAFSYLALAYGLTQRSIAGANPEGDVDAKRLKEIIDLVNKEKIPVIFSEENLDPKIAEAIANETQATIMSLNPIESLSEEDIQAGESYFSLMEKNLDGLKIALGAN